jgi:hypothetical protein
MGRRCEQTCWFSSRSTWQIGEQALVTPAETEAISGYHREHLTRLVRQELDADIRPEGSTGRILIPLAALPLKPGRARPEPAKVRNLAKRMFGNGSSAKGDAE